MKIDTEEDYKEIKAAENLLVKTRLNIVELGKGIRADATAFSKAVIAREKELLMLISPEELRLKALTFAHTEAIRIEAGRAHAEAEALRQRYENVVTALTFNIAFGATAEYIQARLNQCKEINLAELDFLTKQQQTELALLQLTTINALNTAHQQVLEMEAAKQAAQKLNEINAAEADRINAENSLKKATERRLANAPDAEKLVAFAEFLDHMGMPVMSTERGQEIKLALVDEIKKLATRIRVAAEKLGQ